MDANKFRKAVLPPADRTHEVLRALFTLANERGIKDDALASLAGYSTNAMRNWRRGKVTPSIVAVSSRTSMSI